MSKSKVEAKAEALGWTYDRVTECDRCHYEKPCSTVDYGPSNGGEWDYCSECWIWLYENTNALDPKQWA